MRYTKSNYPIGARWVYVDDQGRHGWIEYDGMNTTNRFEIWRYGWCYSDGSGGDFDWTTSYANAKHHHCISGRFKRVKP